MNTHPREPLHLPQLIGYIAAILVSGAAIGSLAISAQSANGVASPAESPDATAALAIAATGARASRCPECGVIESTREVGATDENAGVSGSSRIAADNEIEVKPARNYEITIRLQDGSMRVLTDARPASWRRGERGTIIAGVDR